MLRRLALAAAAFAAVAATSVRPAAADGFYFYEGLGASHYSDTIARYIGDDGVNIRGGIGWRAGHIAVEVYARGEISQLFAADGAAYRTGSGTVTGQGPIVGGDLAILGVDIKAIQPLSKHWSAYARLGLSRMMAGDQYSGNGVGATAGIQVAGKVPALGFLWAPLFFFNAGPKVHSALWFETNTSFHRLHGSYPGAPDTIDAKIQGWTFGFSVGQDF